MGEGTVRESGTQLGAIGTAGLNSTGHFRAGAEQPGPTQQVPQGQQDSPGSPTVHRAEITLNETNIGGFEGEQLLPQPAERCLSRAGQHTRKHKPAGEDPERIQAQPLLGDTDSTQRKIPFGKGSGLPCSAASSLW